MQAITTSLFSTSGREQARRSREAADNGRVLQAQAEVHSSADFTFVTTEGDRVTISADTLQQASYARYNAHGTLQGQRLKVQADALTLTSTQRRAVTVEGELSQEELQDIQQIVRKVSRLARDVFAGTRTGSLDEVLELEDFQTLQSFDATLEYSESLRLEQTSAVPAHPARPSRQALPLPSDNPTASTLLSPPGFLATPGQVTEAPAVQPAPAGVERNSDGSAGVFGHPRQLFEAIRQAVKLSRDTPASVPGRPAAVWRSLADILSSRLPEAVATRQQTLSPGASRFLHRLQDLGRPGTVPLPSAPVAVSGPESPSPETARTFVASSLSVTPGGGI